MNGSETTVHTKCINDQTLRSDIFHPKCPTNVRQICTIISSYTVCVSLICLILIDLSSTFKFYDYNRISRNIVTFPKSKL